MPWSDDALSFSFSKSGFSVFSSLFFAGSIYFPNGTSYPSMYFNWVEARLAESVEGRQQIEASLAAS